MLAELSPTTTVSLRNSNHKHVIAHFDSNGLPSLTLEERVCSIRFGRNLMIFASLVDNVGCVAEMVSLVDSVGCVGCVAELVSLVDSVGCVGCVAELVSLVDSVGCVGCVAELVSLVDSVGCVGCVAELVSLVDSVGCVGCVAELVSLVDSVGCVGLEVPGAHARFAFWLEMRISTEPKQAEEKPTKTD